MEELKIKIIRKGTDYRVETYDPNWDEWWDEGFAANSRAFARQIITALYPDNKIVEMEE